MRAQSLIAPRSLPWPHAFALHLCAFLLPVLTTVFLLNGPYRWWQALLWATIPIWTLIYIDTKAPADRRAVAVDAPDWLFDLQVYALTALQLGNHILLGIMASKLTLQSWGDAGVVAANLWAVIWMSGVTAGYSGIVVAHEWIHRRKPHQYFLGRLLLMFVWYEHFATEHIRGHHPRLGTQADPATARFGETFRQFFLRTVPAQFKSAWQLESERLGRPAMKPTHPAILRHRVFQGVMGQIGITICYLVFFGPIATVFFLVQARTAFTLLEVVNYIEHWGIERHTRGVSHVDSWDTDNWFTLHTLVGLSRHADHHAQASRPYHKLRYHEDPPKLATGYYGSIILALFRNEHYRQLATDELTRRRLGPFRKLAEDRPQATPIKGSATAAS